MHSYYSQKGTIIRAFQDNITALPVSYFMKWHYFVWYKAWTRISELVKEDLLENVTPNAWFWKECFYILTEKWKVYDIKNPSFISRLINKLF